jgi:transcriptional regulator
VYTPRHFAVDDARSRDLLREVVVGELVTATQAGPRSTLLPWVVDLDGGRMLGHMARPNPQWQTPWLGQALVVATGVNGYISPSWYASKAEHGRVVPTWNYVTVHVYGELIVHDDPAWVSDLVRRLTERHEQGRDAPWSVDDAPAAYVEGQLRAIVGLEVAIESVEAKVKMSQNRPTTDVAGVISGLTEGGRTDLATWVRQSAKESRAPLP